MRKDGGGGEDEQEEKAVDQLKGRSRQTKLVEVPVDIEEAILIVSHSL